MSDTFFDLSNPVFYLLIVIAAILIAVVIVVLSNIETRDEIREAGNIGEARVTEMIQAEMTDEDLLFTNVTIESEGKEAEIDNIIVNSHGIFIIEAKNYSGLVLAGEESDYEWTKLKITDSGNVYEKIVRNPIKQVKRQIYVLKEYLRAEGIDVWIEGYVIFARDNGPTDSNFVLNDYADIDNAIHTDKKRLTKKQIEHLAALFGRSVLP